MPRQVWERLRASQGAMDARRHLRDICRAKPIRIDKPQEPLALMADLRSMGHTGSALRGIRSPRFRSAMDSSKPRLP